MDLCQALDRLANTIVVWAGIDATPEEREAWDFLLAERQRLHDEEDNARAARYRAQELVVV